MEQKKDIESLVEMLETEMNEYASTSPNSIAEKLTLEIKEVIQDRNFEYAVISYKNEVIGVLGLKKTKVKNGEILGIVYHGKYPCYTRNFLGTPAKDIRFVSLELVRNDPARNLSYVFYREDIHSSLKFLEGYHHETNLHRDFMLHRLVKEFNESPLAQYVKKRYAQATSAVISVKEWRTEENTRPRIKGEARRFR